MTEPVTAHDDSIDPEECLRKAFGDVACGAYTDASGDTVYTAYIRDLYKWKMSHGDTMVSLRYHFNLPIYGQVDVVQGKSSTRKESISDLYSQIIEHALSDDVNMLERQKNPDEYPLVIGKDYPIVTRQNKRHDHHDPRLANLKAIIVHPDRGLVIGSMNGNHRHFWLGEP